MAKSPETLVDPVVAQAIVEGAHGDPFSVLGLHRRGEGHVLTAFVPGADRLTVLASREIEAEGVAGFPGLFAVRMGCEPYRLRAEGHGAVWQFEDPFRFGPVLGELDEYLLGEGTHRRLWQVLGAHPIRHEGVEGTHFAVWAPNAQRVSVVGDFNIWDGRRHPMRRRGPTGVWETFLPGVGEGAAYKYEIRGPGGELLPLKADPVGFGSEHPPRTASVVRALGQRDWQDADWMATRAARHSVEAPISIYEVHLGSWKRGEGGRMLSYTELARDLVDYAAEMGFTHIELMPISEHPFDGSWGYQPVGLFAPTIRHGTPDGLRALVEAAHAKGLGVLIDWVPGHFPTDAHGLGRFDGTPLYEHADPREGFHQDWNTLIYNFGRTEVANWLTSNALYWLEDYHIDGLRVDAVASMLYRDYSRKAGEWVPNRDGGRENYEAIDLLRRVNATVYGEDAGVMTVAEESTAFPGVSRPVDQGGLGFGFKWNMGWMNDTLDYMSRDPVHRRHHHHQMTFSLHYAWSENYILPISHDEVVHGKGSMIAKMPGEGAEKFANLRAYYGYMWTHPGKKLLFMGCEFAQGREWNHAAELEWQQLDHPLHRGVQSLVRDLNRLYRTTPALHRNDARPEGFVWLEANDSDHSLYAFIRRGRVDEPMVVAAMNFTPVERRIRLGLPAEGQWDEVLNTDAEIYGGGNRGNLGGVLSEPVHWHGQEHSALVTLPPLSTVIFRQG
ncbi:1,4-alpha-glucan branching protein GlgB [Cereibacter azotoformans]|uniref:1,4-alpha-glucan branching enzyme GlgB n=1 Tax=Cereibacter azotoformans TaxID=43057 RepID=A0A2T5K991_9RHOB|nr:1,4-alpha-glucan branching protein GlgB [Cereibacter azotoformans]AXQ93284.1 1,4-alpha-glucan branching protein GlgB [Cereibacter sphaeroides]MBO4169056.1 1,4-alpha-glucan branching protein GlgB [Cereibacter azotoformans]PTR18990.1 1,4-alpha-glucan branching enzyme [Cereibacter azotoformans]UIJ31597.1 1,4-alpha-glucan branching protein GlgB [Cereibacter azotoformans]